jgi:hypothetical protein
MGFKFKRVDLVAGSEEWPAGSTFELIQSRSTTILKKCVQAILDCDCGWVLDASKNVTIDDTVGIPTRVSGITYPGLFLTNSSSGCKLFISYSAASLSDFSGDGTSNLRITETATDSQSAGLCMSMIPAGSNAVFGDPTTISFLPSEATRIIGTINRGSAGPGSVAYATNPNSGYIYSWGLFVTPYVISVSCKSGQTTPGNLYIPAFAVGRIFGSLNHSTDTSSNSKYACLTFRESNGNTSNSEGTTNTIVFNTGNYTTSSNQYFVGVNPYYPQDFSSYTGAYKVFGAIAKADGTWINGTYYGVYCVTLYPADVSQLSGYVYNLTNSGKSRWCPFLVRVISTSLDTYGVIPGDGMKGYLDTDLFRCAIGTYGQQFDNGNFICIDSDYNFLIGWDPDNDPLVGE